LAERGCLVNTVLARLVGHKFYTYMSEEVDANILVAMENLTEE
jgi:hypothetical protein